MQSPKILHVETGMRGLGGPAQVIYLMKGLRERGYQSHLACAAGSGIAKSAVSAGLSITEIPLRTDLDARFIYRLYRLIRQLGPDIVHLHSRRGADTMGSLAAYLAGVPTVVLSRRISDPVKPGTLSQLKFGKLCHHIIAVSEGVARVLTEAGISAEKVTCVHSVIDASLYQKRGSEDKVRYSLGLNDQNKVVAAIGQLSRYKGQRFLLQAAPRILGHFPETVFLLLGDGREKEELRRQADLLNISDRVVFAGFRANIGEILSVVDVLVHPSLREGFANCVLQAMAAEVPVVSSAVGGMPECVRDGINGLLVLPGDSEAIASAVIHLLQSPQMCRRIGDAGRRIVEEEYNPDTMVEGVLSVYRELAPSVFQ